LLATKQQYEGKTMLKLIWTIAALTVQGPLVSDVPETTKFKDRAECTAFGKKMTPRLADWARGALRADWDLEVKVVFRCEADGTPA
jgi:hypothetical protein